MLEKELLEYLNLLRDFGRIYTRRIMSGDAGAADLKQSQVKAIYAFRDRDSYSMKELADNAGVKLPNMTLMIDEMERAGMVSRVRDKDDRRKVMVGLTVKGRKVRNRFLEKRQTFAREMFLRLQRDDKEELLSSLASVCRILDKTLSEKE